jgi:Lhr-like helicase
MGGRSILGNVSTVILDEIHSVINSKRGTYLITAVDRLTALSGEFQRIALSAAVKPLKTVADFIGGFLVRGDPFDPTICRAFEAAWQKRFSQQLDVFADNNCLYLLLPNDISDLELLSMVSSANLENLIRKRLEGSGFFGARFRECAGRRIIGKEIQASG